MDPPIAKKEIQSKRAKASTKPPVVILPTRESSRKRVRKSLGPDFVEDFATPAPKHSSDDTSVKPKTPRNKVSTKPLHAAVINKEQQLLACDTEIPPALTGVNGKAPEEEILLQPEKIIDIPIPDPICCVCNATTSVINGKAGTVLRCCGRNCSYIAHADCLPYSKDTVSLIRDRFKCRECKRCATCGKGNAFTDRNMIICPRCDSLFHLRCNFPPVDPNSEELKGRNRCFAPNWMCYRCKLQAETCIPPPESYPLVTVAVTNEKISLERSVENGLGCLLKNGKDADVFIPGGNAVPQPPDTSSVVKVSIAHEYEDMISGAVPGPSTYGNLLKGNLAPEEYEDWQPAKQKVEEQLREEELRECQEIRRHRRELAKWTSDRCAAQFADSNPQLAELIRNNRLTGASLVCINRNQFIDMFGLSLGVAVKLHYAVCVWRKSFF
ncbi:uncharacterized protein LOC129583773 isoform X2 [Paramacrobiotus metropolitanus]|uniref:uncharacterized protein LOC129583773 isoform X2 n=1 Tax=Paramacrobiotus metropolitanus TaxID=2943436 RepID=UPI002445C5EB|nr:uncharacterized protein LOC129583773 isoform X2 [Paramacrobiotus metropolitanus]